MTEMYKIPRDLVLQLGAYLAKRPYGEVAILANNLAMVVDQNNKPEKEVGFTYDPDKVPDLDNRKTPQSLAMEEFNAYKKSKRGMEVRE